MAKQTYSQELLFEKMLFTRTANFELLTPFSIDRLVINRANTGVFRLNLVGAENLSINTMKKIFESNLLFQRSIEQDYLSKNIKSLSFLGCLIKV